MRSRDEATLLDILRAARLAVRFKGDLDKVTFLDDLKTQSAVLHQLLVLGEAVKRLSDAFRTSHEEVPWRMIAGMRDKLIHGYDMEHGTEAHKQRYIAKILSAEEIRCQGFSEPNSGTSEIQKNIIGERVLGLPKG